MVKHENSSSLLCVFFFFFFNIRFLRTIDGQGNEDKFPRIIRGGPVFTDSF